MNTSLSALIAATVLVFGTADASIARASEAGLSRHTGVGGVIGQQGNDALQRIRSELASKLQQRVALPELPALAVTRSNELASATADSAVRFNP